MEQGVIDPEMPGENGDHIRGIAPSLDSCSPGLEMLLTSSTERLQVFTRSVVWGGVKGLAQLFSTGKAEAGGPVCYHPLWERIAQGQVSCGRTLVRILHPGLTPENPSENPVNEALCPLAAEPSGAVHRFMDCSPGWDAVEIKQLVNPNSQHLEDFRLNIPELSGAELLDDVIQVEFHAHSAVHQLGEEAPV